MRNPVHPDGSNAVPALRIRDLPDDEKPRERLTQYGSATLATSELLAILLATGRQGASALAVGQELVTRFGLAGLERATVADLCAVGGCGQAKAIQIKAALELGRRVSKSAPEERMKIATPGQLAAWLIPEMRFLDQEHVKVVLLNAKNQVLGLHQVYVGTVSGSVVRASEVFREAVRRNCPGLVLVHNHPSGDPTPSPDDLALTRSLVQAGKLLDIEVLDHLIIGDRRWLSLREQGLGF
jgi:DNA repair protein RadC